MKYFVTFALIFAVAFICAKDFPNFIGNNQAWLRPLELIVDAIVYTYFCKKVLFD